MFCKSAKLIQSGVLTPYYCDEQYGDSNYILLTNSKAFCIWVSSPAMS